MIRANDINKAINWGIGASIAYFTLIALKAAVKRKAEEDYYAEKNGTGGIGAAERIKRRIYKEISLAQDAGIDFSKDYSQFTDEEIATLEELGHAASWEQKEQKPYAQAYYESLSKAYNAISGVGIGKAYDIKDANGNTVLTWIEDAASHVAHEREIEDKRQRTLELEARAAEARKRKRATDRAIQHGQMSLFGTGYAAAREPFWYGIKNVQFIPHGDQWAEIYYKGKYYNESEVADTMYDIWREQIEYGDTNLDFEVWMRTVGEEYLKKEVLPLMTDEVTKLFQPRR